MWRDPLDELIDDLERVAPAPRSASDFLLWLEKLDQLLDAILYSSDDEVERIKAGPDFQAWVRQYQEGFGRGK